MKVRTHGINYYGHGTKRHPSMFDWNYSYWYARALALSFWAARADQGEFVSVGADEVLWERELAADEGDWASGSDAPEDDGGLSDEAWLEGKAWLAEVEHAEMFAGVDLPTWGDSFDPAEIQGGYSVVSFDRVPSNRVRIYDLARECGVRSTLVIDACHALGIGVRSHSSTIEPAQADRVRRLAA